jgi:anti-anti-sigma factor
MLKIDKSEIYEIVLPKETVQGAEYLNLNEIFSRASATERKYIFLNCSEVSSFYSQFQAMIAFYGRRLLEIGKELILVNLNKRLYGQLEVSGLNRIIKSFPQEDEALVILKKTDIKKNEDYDFKAYVSEPIGNEQVIELSGSSVDIACRDRLREAFDKVELNSLKKLKLEMKDLEFIDSFSIGVIAMHRSKAKKSGCELKVLHVNELVRDMLELTNIGDMIESSN